MIGMMLIGIVDDTESFMARAEDFIAWVGIEGELWAQYENRLVRMVFFGNDAKGSPIYRVTLEGEGMDVVYQWEWTDEKGVEGWGFYGRLDPDGRATYAWGVNWGFMVRVGPDLFMWA